MISSFLVTETVFFNQGEYGGFFSAEQMLKDGFQIETGQYELVGLDAEGDGIYVNEDEEVVFNHDSLTALIDLQGLLTANTLRKYYPLIEQQN